MSLLAIPNVSAGADPEAVRRVTPKLCDPSALLLDVHTDPVHNRTVFTVHGSKPGLVAAMADLAALATETIDLKAHRGVHPRLGALDVCPFVPLVDEELPIAVEAANEAAEEIAHRCGIPVYLYGAAARRPQAADLPELRRRGLAGLGSGGLPPDLGPAAIDPSRGVICVGARLPLIAFNVWLRADLDTARRVAGAIRSSGGGPPGIRALGLPITEGISQVSMNLIDPATTGIDAAFGQVRRYVAPEMIMRTEVVGLIPERYVPDPDAPAARLMDPPGRSLESLIR